MVNRFLIIILSFLIIPPIISVYGYLYSPPYGNSHAIPNNQCENRNTYDRCCYTYKTYGKIKIYVLTKALTPQDLPRIAAKGSFNDNPPGIDSHYISEGDIYIKAHGNMYGYLRTDDRYYSYAEVDIKVEIWQLDSTTQTWHKIKTINIYQLIL